LSPGTKKNHLARLNAGGEVSVTAVELKVMLAEPVNAGWRIRTPGEGFLNHHQISSIVGSSSIPPEQIL
jgi:hypothetical protein